MKLFLGTNVVLYSNGGVTTAQVATWLERRYGILGSFANVKGGKIAKAIEKSVSDTIQDIASGAPRRPLLAAACPEIEEMMRDWLSSQDVEKQGIKGVPTKAALGGVSGRFKSGKKGSRRPSFIDTGLMQRNYRAWTDEKNG